MLCALFPLLIAVSTAAYAQDKADVDATAAAQSQAQVHFEAALVAYAADDLLTAERELKQAYRLMASPELAFNLGRVCERLGKAKQAARWFQTYLDDGSMGPRERQDAERRVKAAKERTMEEQAQERLLPPTDKAMRSEARRFFERGVHLFNREHYKAARLAFGAAYRMSQAPELLFNLSLTAEKLGEYGEAVTHLRNYLRAFPAAEDREALDAHIAVLRSKAKH